MSALWQDLRHGLRMLARSPGFTAVAVFTLAIALGANTAVFSLMNGILLRALPYPAPDRLVDASVLLPPSEGRPGRKESLDSRSLKAWSAGARAVERPAAYRVRSLTLSGGGSPERLTGVSVSPALFPLLRTSPAQGRAFREEEQQAGQDRVVLLSHALWQRRFRGDARILGASVTLDGAPHTVVGVMPASFSFPTPGVQLWTPLADEAPGAGVISAHYDPVIARLRAGFSIAQAEAEAQTLLLGGQPGQLASAGTPSARVQLVPWRDAMVAQVRPALLAMSAAVGLVLLIACINLANLLLTRNSARHREMAIRSAVGGGPGRLARQMLTESVALSLTGGLAGLLLAGWLHRLLPRLLPRDIPRLEEVQLDVSVFVFTFLLASLTGLAFGLLPALRSARASLVASLRGGAEGLSDTSSRGVLVVAEVALACVLLVGAGLLLRSFLNLLRVEPGYEPDRVLAATIALDPTRYGEAGRAEAFFDALLHRLEERRDVEAAGVVSFPPLAPGFSLTSLSIVGQPRQRTMAIPQMTSSGYLRAMGLRLAAGRWLTAQDLAAQARVAVVNETFVGRYLEGRKAIGRRLDLGGPGKAPLEIVGVLRDVRLLGADSAPKPEVFASFHLADGLAGASLERLTVVIRTTGSPSTVRPFLRTLLHDLDPELAPEEVGSLQVKLSASIAQPRFYALLLGVFAAIALVLAAAGVYGVLSYTVARQARSIGVRRALGAQGKDILAMVLGRGFILVSIGLAIGTAVALGVTRALAHLLFGVTARDPLSYVVAALSLTSVAVLACYIPARRAIGVDPVEALRGDG